MSETLASLLAKRHDILNRCNTLDAQRAEAEAERKAINALIDEMKLNGIGKCYRHDNVFYWRVSDSEHWYVDENDIRKVDTRNSLFTNEISYSEFLDVFKSRISEIWKEVTGQKIFDPDPLMIAALRMAEAGVALIRSSTAKYGDCVQEYWSALAAYCKVKENQNGK